MEQYEIGPGPWRRCGDWDTAVEMATALANREGEDTLVIDTGNGQRHHVSADGVVTDAPDESAPDEE